MMPVANGLSGRCAGRRRGEENLAGRARCAERGHPNCREDRRYDDDGCCGHNRYRADVTEPTAVLGAVMKFLFRGKRVGLRAQSCAEQQYYQQDFPAEALLEWHRGHYCTAEKKVRRSEGMVRRSGAG